MQLTPPLRGIGGLTKQFWKQTQQITENPNCHKADQIYFSNAAADKLIWDYREQLHDQLEVSVEIETAMPASKPCTRYAASEIMHFIYNRETW